MCKKVRYNFNCIDLRHAIFVPGDAPKFPWPPCISCTRGQMALSGPNFVSAITRNKTRKLNNTVEKREWIFEGPFANQTLTNATANVLVHFWNRELRIPNFFLDMVCHFASSRLVCPKNRKRASGHWADGQPGARGFPHQQPAVQDMTQSATTSPASNIALKKSGTDSQLLKFHADQWGFENSISPLKFWYVALHPSVGKSKHQDHLCVCESHMEFDTIALYKVFFTKSKFFDSVWFILGLLRVCFFCTREQGRGSKLDPF